MVCTVRAFVKQYKFTALLLRIYSSAAYKFTTLLLSLAERYKQLQEKIHAYELTYRADV